MATPVIHWTFSAPRQKKGTPKPAFCNRNTTNVTTDKLKVTCGTCIRLMKLHGHYACDTCGQRLDCINSPYGVGDPDEY